MKVDTAAPSDAKHAVPSIIVAVELPIPVEHFAAMSFGLGEGLAAQNLVDPETVPSTLFGDALAYLWLGVLAAQSSEFTPQTAPRNPSKKRARRPRT